MKTASNKTSNCLPIKTFDPVNENSIAAAALRKKYAGNGKLQASLQHLNQAYDEQLMQAHRLKTNAAKLEKSLKVLKQECMRYQNISQNLSVRKLRRKVAPLSRIMEPHAHSESQVG
mgnify:CR=1 FL=1|jgi:hypothetical protein